MKHLFTFLLTLLTGAAVAQSTTINTFDETLHTGGATIEETHTFPADNSQYEQILMHIALTCPNGGCDPWDRYAHIRAQYHDKWFEIGRYITPYGNGNCTWTLDVTPYRDILKGDVTLQSHIATWSNGWLLTVDFEFIEGTPEYQHVAVSNLWVDYEKIYGDTLLVSNNLPELMGVVPANAEKVVLRVANTGHGQGNYMNAAEFSEMTHQVKINGNNEFSHHLWKDDCDQNPCSPQAGTWQFARAGWCPGQEVRPADYDITSLVSPGWDYTVDYVLEDYYNLCSPWYFDCDAAQHCPAFNNDCLYNGNTHTQPNYKISVQVLYFSNTPISSGQLFPTNVPDAAPTNSGMLLYPNPTAGQLTLEMDHHWFQNATVTITDLAGNVVWAADYDARTRNIERIDLSNNPAGIYFLHVAGPVRNITEKFVLTR